MTGECGVRAKGSFALAERGSVLPECGVDEVDAHAGRVTGESGAGGVRSGRSPEQDTEAKTGNHAGRVAGKRAG